MTGSLPRTPIQLSEMHPETLKSVCLFTVSTFIILKECRLKRAKTFWNFYMGSRREPNKIADFVGRIIWWRFGTTDVFST